MTTELGPRRENVPDPKQVADWLVGDVSVGKDADSEAEAQGWLDGLGTLTGLTEDDLCAVALELARRLAVRAGNAPAHD
jgi:hypothetical protein